MIRLLADTHLYALRDYLPDEVRLTTFDPSQGIPDISDSDALFVRTVSKVNAHTLPNPSGLSFVATGSSGSDHLDKDYLNSAGITFADARGCNARSVAEYVITSILIWSENKGIDPQQLSFGIVGAGAVGSSVINLCNKLGWQVMAFDPPRELRDPEFRSCNVKDLLRCDVVSLHIPLEYAGLHPTYHWLDRSRITSAAFRLVINAARGGIADEQALLEWKSGDTGKTLITDVWEGEPALDPVFLKQSYIATPHIAGYSEQSKRRATRMIVDALCDFFGLAISYTEHSDVRRLGPEKFRDKRSLCDVLKTLHPLMEYDRKLRSAVQYPNPAEAFRDLRTEGDYRYEFSFIEIPEEIHAFHPVLSTLGLRSFS